MSYGFQITTGTGASTVEISNSSISPGLALDSFFYTVDVSTQSITIVSSGTLTINIGSFAFPRNYEIGQTVRLLYSLNAPTVNNYIQGTVTAITSTSVTINITGSGGSGTYASWYLCSVVIKDYSTYYNGTGLYVAAYSTNSQRVFCSELITSGKVLTVSYPLTANTPFNLVGSAFIVVYGI